jgi:arginine exporter protein ArgO
MLQRLCKQGILGRIKKGHLPIVWLCILSDLSLMLLIYHILKNLISLQRLLSTLIVSAIAVHSRKNGMPVLFL